MYCKSTKSTKQQALADKLPAMNLPEDMQITVHYSKDEVLNAFATVSGHIFFYKDFIGTDKY